MVSALANDRFPAMTKWDVLGPWQAAGCSGG